MTKEVLKRVDFEKAVPEYAARFPMEMAILRLGGVYPGERIEGFTNPYTGEVDNEYFGNVGEHCVAVAYAAEVLARNVLGVDNPQSTNIVRRALVHDSTKRFEVMRKKAVKAGVIEDAYSPKSYETIKPVLEAQGVASDIVDYMANAGSETGHNSLTSFVQIEEGTPSLRTQDNLPEMIVHLADDMTHTPITQAGETADTYYLTAEERMHASDFPHRYPFIYKEGFGFNEQGKPVLVKDVAQTNEGLTHIKTYAEWHVWVANEIAAHLTDIISPNTPRKEAGQFLKQLVNETL